MVSNGDDRLFSGEFGGEFRDAGMDFRLDDCADLDNKISRSASSTISGASGVVVVVVVVVVVGAVDAFVMNEFPCLFLAFSLGVLGLDDRWTRNVPLA